ncbi:MAG: polysaccharide deacetylase family protein [Candidatus Omnitrophica bacterium]|nr:polysaccharide deacetylase family protein [Candidatus Omnitrophota bacterium]
MRKLKIAIIVFGLVFLAGLMLANFLRRIYVVPILAYHSINPVENPRIERLIVPPEVFERQMRFLKEHRYNVMPLEALADLIRAKKRIPGRTCAITFDDGYKDNYTYAFPILKKYNLPATMFVIINEVGRTQNDRLSWDELKAMQASGIITIGSHALGPEPLINIKSKADLKSQIFDSKKILEARLARPVNMFCYPEGRFNEEIRQLVVDAGYKLAAATSPGSNFSKDDVFLLKRLRISRNCNNLFIFWFKLSGYYTFFKERRHGR